VSHVRLDADRDSSASSRLIFNELDRVKLKKSLETEGAALGAGLEGTIVLCHGNEAFEVEFEGIHDFFQIEWDDLEKI